MSRFLSVIKVYPPPPSTYSGTMSINHSTQMSGSEERATHPPISLATGGQFERSAGFVVGK